MFQAIPKKYFTLKLLHLRLNIEHCDGVLYDVDIVTCSDHPVLKIQGPHACHKSSAGESNKVLIECGFDVHYKG